MTVKEYEVGSERPEGHVRVQAQFVKTDCVKLVIKEQEDGDKTASYLVFLNIDEDEENSFELIKELTGARTNNLWFKFDVDDFSFTLVRDMGIVTELEEVLYFYEEAEKKGMH